MDVLHYNHLLLRRKNAAQSRIQEDTDRALRETEEDLRAEESRVKALANLDHRRQKLRQDLINESLKSVQVSRCGIFSRLHGSFLWRIWVCITALTYTGTEGQARPRSRCTRGTT